MKKLVKQNPVLSQADMEITSSAVLNRSRTIFPKTAVALRREGFSDEEIYAFKPSHKSSAREKFQNADIIIGMSKAHGLLTPKQFRGKYVPLSVAASGKYKSVPDPFLSHSQKSYDRVMENLKKYLVQYTDKLEKEYSAANSKKIK
jgi:protein-tyrosine-phosphatase